eukprot:m51a1_g1237 putative probable atp-dependent rna helicase dhx35 isoform x1 (678) ;mRNA; r:547885-550280
MAFWKPGTAGPGIGLDRESENEPKFAVQNPFSRLPIQQQRVKLPIFQHKTSILYALEKYSVVIIVGETGCGKTTQIPQYLDESGWTAGGRLVCCTQPRRVAATSVAARVSQEMGVSLGQEVGFCVRFENCTSPATRIKYVTDGMLVRETMLDPLLPKYSAIMVDEAHERSLYTDILLGLLKKIMRKRKDLRLIVSSATLDAEMFKSFFEANRDASRPDLDTCVVMSLEGRTFPVDTFYRQLPAPDYVESAVETALAIHAQEPQGDILIFLTGQEEIDTAVELIMDRAKPGKFVRSVQALPLYAGLPYKDQLVALEPLRVPGTRKVVVSTNVAETSLTIQGIVHVIDCGFVKLRVYDGRSSLDALVVSPESQASANQRAGRAGRTCPGRCYRLFTQEAFSGLRLSTVPEIQRTNLATLVLQLKALGIDDILHFDFISPPPVENLANALELAYALGAIDNNCKLTEPLGTMLAEFPVDPQMAKMIITSGELGCSEEVLTIAAMMSVQNVFVHSENKAHLDKMKRSFAVYEGDHITLHNVYCGFIKSGTYAESWCQGKLVNIKVMQKAVQVRQQLAKYARKYKIPLRSCGDDVAPITRSILSGYFANVALYQTNEAYVSLRGRHVLYVHPWSVLVDQSPQWVVFHELMLTSRPYMRDVSRIDPIMLPEIAPHYFQMKQHR